MIYDGKKKKEDALKVFLDKYEAPPWRREDKPQSTYDPSDDEIEVVNLALYLRKPILLSGNPGIGKSSLAKSVAETLHCGDVLHWQITTQSILKDGLYEYDAIARLHEGGKGKVEDYIQLGALGTAFASESIRVVLLDELDKSDIDFPNNLLHVFEEREFPIPELARLGDGDYTVKDESGKPAKITIKNGKLKSKGEFPFVVMTSNKEREFSPALMRRVISHDIVLETDKAKLKIKLRQIVENHLGKAKIADIETKANTIIDNFIDNIVDDPKNYSIDMLMKILHLEIIGVDTDKNNRANKLLHKLCE